LLLLLCIVSVFLILYVLLFIIFFFFSSRRRHTRSYGDWSSDVCSSDLCQAEVTRQLERAESEERDRVFSGTCEVGLGSHPLYPQDRKSTRLNSSHRTISYAVFCLKKKKKKKKTNHTDTTTIHSHYTKKT